MQRETEQRAGGLIIGSAGPFYIALNRATFYLLGALFLTIAPVVIFFLRDASTPVRIVVAFGISMETGTLAHIWLERIRDMRGALPWLAHLAVTATLLATILVVLASL